MKSKLLSAFGVPLVLWLALIGCDTGNGPDTQEEPNKDPKSIILTGVSGDDIPGEYDNIRIRIIARGTTGSIAGHDGLALQKDGTIKTPLVIVQAGDTIDPDNCPDWTGSGKYYIALYFYDKTTLKATFVHTNGKPLNDSADYAAYNFTEAQATIAFSLFKKMDF
jgi:hypothetical protein